MKNIGLFTGLLTLEYTFSSADFTTKLADLPDLPSGATHAATDTVLDHATIGNNKAVSTGIEAVWVAGQLVYQGQKPTGNKPGVLVKRASR